MSVVSAGTEALCLGGNSWTQALTRISRRLY